MTVRIDACIEGHDADGEGATLDDALEAIAANCESAAEGYDRTAAALRGAAVNYRDRIMRMSEPPPAPPEPPPTTERLERESVFSVSTADVDWMDVHDGGPHA